MIKNSTKASQTLKAGAITGLFAFLMLLVPCINLFLLSGHEEYARGFKKHVIKELKKKNIDISWSKYPQALELSSLCKQWDGHSAHTYAIVNNEPYAIPSTTCKKYEQARLIDRITHTIALMTLIFTLTLIILLLIMGFLARRSREYLFRFFKPGLYLSQISTILLTVANIACLMLYYYSSGTGAGPIAIIGVFAFVAIVLICYQSFKSVHLEPRYVWGKTATKTGQPRLWAYIESIARHLNTTPPDTIIVGIDPTFYVTEAPLIEYDGETEKSIEGKSLYLSLPYCTVLSKDELASIIGHEMGHFVGEDTIWSQKFFPIYQSTENMIDSLGSSFSMMPRIFSLAAFAPSYIFMKFFLRVFETAEKKMSRERELHADFLGMQVANKEAQATALVKTYRYHPVFGFMDNYLLDACMKAAIPSNIVSWFSETARDLPDLPEIKASLNTDISEHPTDTHPPLLDRLRAIGVTLDDVYDRSHVIPVEPAASLFDNAQKLEEELTAIEARKFLMILAHRAARRE